MMDLFDRYTDGDSRRPLIILTGPTAVGKTELSLGLAQRLDAEIVSADSVQVYRGMDIGSAKIRPDEMRGIRHHMLDILDPDEEFSVLIFKEKAKAVLEDIYSRRHIPIVTGGTGFYIQALLYDIDFTEYDDERQSLIRQKLEEELRTHGALYMHEKLASFDPESAAIIHMNNTKRLLHAIEYYELTGQKISDHNAEQHERTSPYNFIYLVLNDDRDRIYSRIDRRVDMMFEQGLLDEVKKLKSKGYDQSMTSMMSLGYKETADYLDGLTSLEEAIYLIKRDTRHFAKKQLTWFKREKDTVFIDKETFASDRELEDHAMGLIDAHLRKM